MKKIEIHLASYPSISDPRLVASCSAFPRAVLPEISIYVRHKFNAV